MQRAQCPTRHRASETPPRLSRRRLLRLAALLGASSATAFVLEACGSSRASRTTPSSTAGGRKLAATQVLRYPYGEPATLDPGLATGGATLLSNIWEPLLGFDVQGTAIPLGATGWDVAPDGTTYTFHLREGLRWTDGMPLTARDYEWTWRRNLDPKTASPDAHALYPVKGARAFNQGKEADPDSLGVTALDDRTLRVVLEEPAAYFLHIVATWTAMPLPRQAIEHFGAKWTEPGNVVSNGAFQLDAWQHDQQIVLARNESHWGVKPTLERIIIPFFDVPGGLAAYENDELDVTWGPWPADQGRIAADTMLSRQLHPFRDSQTAFLVCDTANTGSPVSKLPFRQALYLAIDRETIANSVFKKVYTPAYTMLPPDILGYNPEARLTGGVKEARQALAIAGYPNGKGAPTLMLAYSRNANNDLLVEALQQMWRDVLGLSVNLDAMEPAAFTRFRQSLTNARYDLYLSSWGSDYPDPFNWHNFLFTSDADFFHAHWANADFDRLAGEAAGATDQNHRRDLYHTAEAILVRELPQIPIYHSGTPYLIKPWVEGLLHLIVGGDRFAQVKLLKH